MGHGGMSCGMKTLRFVLVVFNIFFFLVGLALLALGIYLKVDPTLSKIKQLLPINSNPGVQNSLSYLDVISIAIIVLGCVLLVIGFLGCCGAMKQVKVFLAIYAIIIILIILAEIAITIYFVAFQSKFEDEIKPQLVAALQSTYQGPIGLLTGGTVQSASITWDLIMYNLQCCGINNGSDFLGATAWNRTNPWWNSNMSNATEYFTYPITCCNVGNAFSTNWNSLPVSTLQSLVYCAVNGTNIYTEGCFDKVMDLINTAKTWIIVGAVIVLVIELAALIFAFCLCCRKRKERYSS